MYKLSCIRSLAQTHSLTSSRAFPGFLTLFEWFVHLLSFSLSLTAHRYVCGKKTKNKWKSGNDWFSKTINTIVFGNEVFFFFSSFRAYEICMQIKWAGKSIYFRISYFFSR